jgi:hypothetical protein
MARYALIDGYLDSMRSNIRWRRDLDDLVAEMEDHLYSTTEHLLARGADVVDAQRATLARFGDPTVLAAAYASNQRGGIAVPTKFTKRAGLLALISAVSWIAAAVLMIAINDSEDWQITYYMFSIVVLVAGVLTVIAMVGVGRRVGGLGALGLIGVVVACIGVLFSIVAWAIPLWMGLQGFGLLLIGGAVLRAGTVVPRTAVVLSSVAFLSGPVVFIILDALEVGWQDSYGDYPLAWIISTGVAVALMAVGLVGVGMWLRAEEPVDVDATAIAA